LQANNNNNSIGSNKKPEVPCEITARDENAYGPTRNGVLGESNPFHGMMTINLYNTDYLLSPASDWQSRSS